MNLINKAFFIVSSITIFNISYADCPNVQGGHGVIQYRQTTTITLPCAWADNNYFVAATYVRTQVGWGGIILDRKNVGNFTIGAAMDQQHQGTQEFDWVAVHN